MLALSKYKLSVRLFINVSVCRISITVQYMPTRSLQRAWRVLRALASVHATHNYVSVTERAAIRAAAQEEEVFEANGQVPVPRSHNLPSVGNSLYNESHGVLIQISASYKLL